MASRRDFILESGGLEFHVIRYQPTNEPDASMTSTSQDNTNAPTEEGIGVAIQQQPAPGA